MACVQELAQRPHQLGDVVEVQAGGGFVEKEERALLGHALAGRGRRFGQKARQLQALRFTPRERGHGLAQAHVVQAHIHDGLQLGHHLAVLPKELHGLGHGEVQHIGHAEFARAAQDLHLEDFVAKAPAVAVLAAQVHVAEELHLHMLKA